jgi:hypothetical protein
MLTADGSPMNLADAELAQPDPRRQGERRQRGHETQYRDAREMQRKTGDNR